MWEKMLWAVCVGGLALAALPAGGHERQRVDAPASGSDFCFIAIHPLECGSAPARDGAAPLFGDGQALADAASDDLPTPGMTLLPAAEGAPPSPLPEPANPWLLIAGLLPMLAWRHRPRD